MKLSGFFLISAAVHLVLLFAWPGFFGVHSPARIDVQQGLSILEISLPAVIPVKTPQPQPVPPEILTPAEPVSEPVPAEPEPDIEAGPPDPALAQPASEPATPASGDAGAFSPAAMQGQTRPVYPRMSQIRGEEGVVKLIVHINTEGRCAQAELKTSSGFERLDQAALTWARRARYTPAREGDTFIDSRLKLSVPFELRRKGR